jgi:TolB-like protein/DNA-binding winged helix-turn-helix (wHTH) protein/Tfp pilus assembly protein PilF
MGDRFSHPIYEFGDFHLDPVQRLLRSRVDGRVVQLMPRVFEMLLYLVEHPGQLLEKSTLMKAVWPNVVVEEGNLTQAIHELRRALEERPGDHRFIVTVPGRGYSFVADVALRSRPPHDLGPTKTTQAAIGSTAIAASAAAAPGEPSVEVGSAPTETTSVGLDPLQVRVGNRSRHVLWPSMAVLVLALGIYAVWLLVGTGADPSRNPVAERTSPASIAVLSFTDLSPGRDQGYFSDGLSEELIHLLAHTASLRVIARTSSFSFKHKDVDVATIARQLGVTHVLEGSVRRAGNRVRISVQLIDGASSLHVWSQTYDQNVDDIIAVQREIATSVASALKATLAGAKVAATTPVPTDLRVYEQFLRARFLYYRRHSGDIKEAEAVYRLALETDPTFARAWAGLSAVYLVEAAGETNELGLSRDVALARARDAAEGALKLAPDLAEAHVRFATYRFETGDRAGAREQIYRAAALEPDNPLVLGILAGIAVREGRLEDAIDQMRQAVVRDPLALAFRYALGVHLFYAARFGEARTELQRSLQLGGPPAAAPSDRMNAQVAHDIAQTLIAENRHDEALALIQSWPEGAYRDHGFALVEHARGNRIEADKAVQRLIAAAERPHHVAMVAEIYANRGDVDQAYKWLTKAAERSRQQQDVWQDWRLDIRYSPFVGALHQDPRWKAWLAETY